MNVTDKQIAYIASLKAQRTSDYRREYEALIGTRSNKATNAAYYALLLELPTPQTSQEASEQIDALQTVSGIMSYGRRHQAWGQPILSQLAGCVGDKGERLPEMLAELASLIHA